MLFALFVFPRLNGNSYVYLPETLQGCVSFNSLYGHKVQGEAMESKVIILPLSLTWSCYYSQLVTKILLLIISDFLKSIVDD